MAPRRPGLSCAARLQEVCHVESPEPSPLLALVTVCAGALLAVSPRGAAAEAAAPAAHTARHGPTARPKST